MRSNRVELNGPSPGWRPLRVMFSTGEVSGDLVGADLARKLGAICPHVTISGFGGQHMAAAGVQMLLHTDHLGAVGITEILPALPGSLHAFQIIRRHVRHQRPHVAVLIGLEILEVALGRWLRRQGIHTIAYFPPPIWLWRRRARFVAQSFDGMLTSFRSEHRAYRRAGAQVTFAGHYLCDRIEKVSTEQCQTARRRFGITPGQRVIGLLPGSRRQEIQRLGPVILDSAARLAEARSDIRFVLPLADGRFEADLAGMIRRRGLQSRVRLCRNSRAAMQASELLIVCSGTATLEATLMGIPMVIVYRLSHTTLAILKILDLVGLMDSREKFGLPNLLAEQMIVPELFQSQVRPGRLCHDVLKILDDPVRQRRMKQHLQGVSDQLGAPGGTARAARIILEKAMVAAG